MSRNNRKPTQRPDRPPRPERPENPFTSKEAQQRAIERNKRRMEEQRTIRGLKRIIRRMQIAGIVMILAGAFMHSYAPLYAEKQWTLLIGVKMPLPRVAMLFGCVMLVVSVVCFLRSFRCPKCGTLLALTPYTKITRCRGCGAELSESDNYYIKEENEEE